MQILGPHSRPTESKTLGFESTNLFYKPMGDLILAKFGVPSGEKTSPHFWVIAVKPYHPGVPFRSWVLMNLMKDISLISS